MIRTVGQDMFGRSRTDRRTKDGRRCREGRDQPGAGAGGEKPFVPLSSSSEELIALSPMDGEKEEVDGKGNRGEYEDEPTLGQKDGMDMRNREPGAR
jgi:hypothetical protein